MVLVRFLNSTVMVRVGGGWVTLQKFLENHDPCKGKPITALWVEVNLEMDDWITSDDDMPRSPTK